MEKNELEEKRREKGLGSVRLRKRNDGSTGYQLKIVVDGVAHVRTVDAKSETAAKKLLLALRSEIHSGELARKETEASQLAVEPTFGEWCATYLKEGMSPDTAESTRVTYGSVFRRLPADLRDCKLSKLEEGDLKSWLWDLRRSGRISKSSEAALTANTVALMRAAIGSCLEAAVEKKLLAKNPVPRLKALGLGDRRKRARDHTKRTALNRAQVAALLACAPDSDLQLWIRLMSATAMRPGEAGALRWGDLNFETREIHIGHSVKPGKVRGQGVLGSTKSESSERTVPMAPALMAVLQAARAEQEAIMRKAAGFPDGVAAIRDFIEPSMCIFYADLATKELRAIPRALPSLRTRFKAAAKAAGLPTQTVPHSLRHSAITAMLAGSEGRRGVGVADAARLAGHASPSITLDVYTHAVAENLSRGAELADALIGPAPEAEVQAIPRTK